MGGEEVFGDGFVDQVCRPVVHRLPGDGDGLDLAGALSLDPDAPIQGGIGLSSVGIHGRDVIDVVPVPDGELALSGEHGVQAPVLLGLLVEEHLHQQQPVPFALDGGPHGDQGGGVGLSGGVGERLRAQRILGELVDGLVALKGGGRRSGGQQSGQEHGGEQDGETFFIRNSFLADVGRSRGRPAKDDLSKEGCPDIIRGTAYRLSIHCTGLQGKRQGGNY